MSPPLRELDDASLEIWYAPVASEPDPQVWADCRTLLDDAERERADRYLFERDQYLFAVAHALVRVTLSRYAACSPQDWRFESNRHGRPEIVVEQNPGQLRFNLSHTRGMAVCAVARGRDIGIDVESTRRRDVGEAVARRFFAPPEVDALRQLADDRRHRAFLTYWTLKESYIKARGMGLAIPLAQFWFTPPDVMPVQIAFGPQINDQPRLWQFERLQVDENFVLAVAARRDRVDQSLAVQLIGHNPGFRDLQAM